VWRQRRSIDGGEAGAFSFADSVSGFSFRLFYLVEGLDRPFAKVALHLAIRLRSALLMTNLPKCTRSVCACSPDKVNNPSNRPHINRSSPDWLAIHLGHEPGWAEPSPRYCRTLPGDLPWHCCSTAAPPRARSRFLPGSRFQR